MSQVVTGRLMAALQELKRVADTRRQLRQGSQEYLAALDHEARIATEVRRLASGRFEAEDRRDWLPSGIVVGPPRHP